jgi:hypothetical protein
VNLDSILEQVLSQIIPYRLCAVETFSLVLRRGSAWSGTKPLQIFIDGRLAIEGNSNAFINPVVESGVVHCRALLEFLGLKSKNDRLVRRQPWSRPDDIGIEHFPTTNGPLSVATVQSVLDRWPGGQAEAEQALLSVFRTANKGVAHFTSSIAASPEETRLLEIAARAVPALIESYLYTPLGRPAPLSQITSRPREAREP